VSVPIDQLATLAARIERGHSGRPSVVIGDLEQGLLGFRAGQLFCDLARLVGAALPRALDR
jgi:hypothetical protein